MTEVKQVCDKEKLKELILYIAAKSESDVRFGATKLSKIIYYADFAAYRTTGSSITGADYQKLVEGPVPKQLLPCRKELIRDNAARIETRQYYDSTQQRLVALRQPDHNLFTSEQLRIVDQVIADLLPKNGTEVSQKSRKELGWLLAEMGETIPYASAFLVGQDEPLSEEQEAHGRVLARRRKLVVA